MSHQITYLDGKWQVYRVVNGKYRLNVGPRWQTGVEARHYCDLMDALPEVSPLMGERDANTGNGPLSSVDDALTHERGDSLTR